MDIARKFVYFAEKTMSRYAPRMWYDPVTAGIMQSWLMLFV